MGGRGADKRGDKLVLDRVQHDDNDYNFYRRSGERHAICRGQVVTTLRSHRPRTRTDCSRHSATPPAEAGRLNLGHRRQREADRDDQPERPPASEPSPPGGCGLRGLQGLGPAGEDRCRGSFSRDGHHGGHSQEQVDEPSLVAPGPGDGHVGLLLDGNLRCDGGRRMARSCLLRGDSLDADGLHDREGRQGDVRRRRKHAGCPRRQLGRWILGWALVWCFIGFRVHLHGLCATPAAHCRAQADSGTTDRLRERIGTLGRQLRCRRPPGPTGEPPRGDRQPTDTAARTPPPTARPPHRRPKPSPALDEEGRTPTTRVWSTWHA